MKDNRGFTLVELLAVIVLIAVLSVVAVSTYRGINESSKQKTLEAKIQQITSAAEKWARENNITTKTTLSVNTLVVEGYITADSAGTDGLAYIKNPVTEENMICNVVELSFKDGIMKSLFNGNVQNCKLATQSLVDSNINIRVVSESGKDLTGSSSGSIAKWTNENVEIIVNSTEYDPKAASISYDIEGSTITKNVDGLTKYTGTSYVNNPNDYYNVYYLKAELLLNTKIVVTYYIPGEGTKSRQYTIRFDKEEATAILKSNSDWLTSKDKAQITVDDGKGSGPAAIYISRTTTRGNDRRIANPTVHLENLDVGKYYIWTEDNAGNISHTYKIIMEINNIDESEPACKVNFHGTIGDHGWYRIGTPFGLVPGGETTEPAGVSGVNVGVNQDPDNPVYTAYAQYQTTIEGFGENRITNTLKTGELYYCHAKSLAGNYNTASDRLFLDLTRPTVEVNVDNPNVHEQHKTVHVTVRDSAAGNDHESGLNASSTVRYGLSQSNTVGPTSWSDVEITTTDQSHVANKTFTTTELVTGTWFLWIDASGLKDYAGNVSTGNVSGTTYVFGPYKFDNTPPVCDGVGGKTNWTNGTYTAFQPCRDDDGTTDQSLCTQASFSKSYLITDNVRTDTITIRDNAGNTTVCPINVYLEHIAPSCTLTEPGPDGLNGWYKAASVTISATFKDNGAADLQSGVYQKGTAKTSGSTNNRTSVTFTENGASLTAFCYVKDVAGNDNSSHLTFKKDDGTEARNGGCSIIGENFSWVNTTWTYWTILNVLPVSGSCISAEHDYGSVFTEDCKSYVDIVQGTTLSCAEHQIIHFQTYSGEDVICDFIDRPCLYCDTVAPKCDGSTGESTTWTKNNRTITVGCDDGENLPSNTRKHHSLCTQSTFSKTFNTTTEVGQVPIRDKAGNVTQCPVNVYVDKTGPTCGTVTGGSTTWTSGNRTISVACSDAHSGCAQASYSKTFNTTTRTGTITMSDSVGNTRDCTVNAYVDKSSPDATCTKSNQHKTSGVTCKVTCSDTGSGCSSSGDQGTYTGLTSSKTYTVKDGVGHTDSCTCSVSTEDCECQTCYGDWSDWYCTNSGSLNLRTATKECNDGLADCAAVGSGYKYICRTRSSWSCKCKTCYY